VGLIAIKGTGVVYRGSAKWAKCEQLKKVVIGNDEEKFFQVGI